MDVLLIDTNTNSLCRVQVENMILLALIPVGAKAQINLILTLFTKELRVLGNGIPIYDSSTHNNRILQVRLLRTICDLPARKVVCKGNSNELC